MNQRNKIQLQITNKIVENNWSGIVDVSPRVGKCKITLDSLNSNFNICIIYPEINIKTSWVNDIIKWDKKFKSIKYCTTKSIKKLKQHYDVIICDEIHNFSDNQLKDLKKFITDYKIENCLALSGSLSNETKENISLILGLKTIYKYTIQEAINDKIISDYNITIYYTKLDTNKNKLITWKDKKFYVSEKDSFNSLSNKISDYMSYTSKQLKFFRLNRMRIIKESKAKIELTKKLILEYNNKKLLVFTGLTLVADTLGIPSYHSKTDEINKDNFLEGRSNKLAIVNKLNTGVTFPKLDLAIINYFDSNCENMAQKISRITNLDYTNKVANIIIICSDEEVEKKWLEKSLVFFDPGKINHIKL